MFSTNQAPVLELSDVACMKKTQIDSTLSLKVQSTLLFHLNTLYSTQQRVWQKYDNEWAQFELDHVKYQAPIPSSAQFLLVHLIQKAKAKCILNQLQNRNFSPHDNPDSEIASCTSMVLDSAEKRKETPTARDLARGLVKLGSVQGSDDEAASENKNSRANVRVGKVPGTEVVQSEVLDEAYRMARIRLQMCQSSILFKFNDDDRRIFAELRSQLTETYNKLK